ncbi:MAG TPA: LacI family DNA-binding transcriptional regulator [Dysgonamonadaceae bacterium]|nr:LacI family DNA-binding transcriptional regulator [Dysgonamonadaceae bacterium]
MKKKRITMRDLAKLANVSVATISMALNGKEGIGEETRERVLNLAKEYNYLVNRNARSLKTNNNQLIGVITPDIQNPFFSWIVSELNKYIDKNGYTMLLGISGQEIESSLVREMCSRGVEGIILIPSFNQSDRTYNHYFFNVPIVICTVNSNYQQIPSVCTDLKLGEYKLTSHLIQQGYQGFAFVGTNIENWITKERYEGFLQALDENNLNETDLFYEVEEPSFHSGYGIAEKVLASNPEVITCINDVLALGLLKYCTEIGLSIPNDIAIAGYDDIWVSSLVTPQLTTVKQPVEKIAKKSVEILLNQFKNKDLQEYSVHIEPELLIRNTTK